MSKVLYTPGGQSGDTVGKGIGLDPGNTVLDKPPFVPSPAGGAFTAVFTTASVLPDLANGRASLKGLTVLDKSGGEDVVVVVG